MLQSRGGTNSYKVNPMQQQQQHVSSSVANAESGMVESKHAFGLEKKQSDGGLLLSEKKKGALYSSLSMMLLMLQGTAMSIVLRYSRIQTGPAYLPSVSVFLAEMMKLSICMVVQLVKGPEVMSQKNGTLGQEDTRQTRVNIVAFFWDALPMALPASMFVLQQVLLIWSATYLDAVTYQIFNQAFKLIPTAIFARVLLGQKLKPIQWLSIPVLAFGVILITVNTNASASSALKGGADASVRPLEWYMAMVACSMAGLSSAFAGVYFERYVKGKLAAGLVKRNAQLGIFGVPFSGTYAYLKDGDLIRKNGWLSGFSSAAWGVVWLQVFGGFIIAVVVKYCDNILKNFALAGSVILTVLVSIPLFDQWPSSLFLVGVSAVLLSVFMYGGNVSVPKPLQSIFLKIESMIGRGTNKART
jgi:UDP-sugar transporter A1/2/3